MSLNNRGSIEPYMPDSIQFYQHQVDGIRQMCGMRSFLLADEMGLGKSIQTLAVFAIAVHMGEAETALVVVPASLKSNWYEEIGKFTTFHRVVLAGTPIQRNKQITEFKAKTGPKILIVNYEQVTGHLKQFNEMAFHVGIFDEAHYLKNPKAKRTKACLNLYVQRAFLLTGSPLMNHVNELWSLLERIKPGIWGTYGSFQNRYCVFGGYKDKQIVSVKNEKELTVRLREVMIRRLKKDQLDLPKVQYIDRFAELLPGQQKMYDEIKKELKWTKPDGEVVAIDNPLVKFLRLKQICGTTACLDPATDISGKLDLAITDVEPILESGQRVVVFTQFREVQSAYVNRLSSLKYINGKDKGRPRFPIYQLHGDVPMERRQEIVHAWGNDPRAGVLVCMYQVAGVGLNMTAASIAQRLDRLFTPENNAQAVARLDRIGQTGGLGGGVQILDYHIKNSVEQRVEKIILTKKAVFENIVERDDWSMAVVNKTIEEEMKREMQQARAA